MLRDNLVGLIEPMLCSAGANPLALRNEDNKPSDDRPPCLENPRPEGAESTLTENAASPFQAEPRQSKSPLHQPPFNRSIEVAMLLVAHSHHIRTVLGGLSATRKRAFYFPEIHNSLKFSRLQIIALISMSYGLRIPRTICTARLS